MAGEYCTVRPDYTSRCLLSSAGASTSILIHVPDQSRAPMQLRASLAGTGLGSGSDQQMRYAYSLQAIRSGSVQKVSQSLARRFAQSVNRTMSEHRQLARGEPLNFGSHWLAGAGPVRSNENGSKSICQHSAAASDNYLRFVRAPDTGRLLQIGAAIRNVRHGSPAAATAAPRVTSQRAVPVSQTRSSE